MPRTQVRKTTRGLIDTSVYQIAAEEVVNDNLSVRAGANKHNLCHVTLYRYIKKKEKYDNDGNTSLPRVGYHSVKRVFTDEKEQVIGDYVIKASTLFYGLSPKDIRKLA